MINIWRIGILGKKEEIHGLVSRSREGYDERRRASRILFSTLNKDYLSYKQVKVLPSVYVPLVVTISNFRRISSNDSYTQTAKCTHRRRMIRDLK